jgi:hypothetical protein
VSLRERLDAQLLPPRTVPVHPSRPGAGPYLVEVRALPGDVWDDLVRLHPPTPEQAGRGDEWNLVTFRPALLAACVSSPDDAQAPLTVEEWSRLLLVLSVGERDQLYVAAYELNANRWPDFEALGKGSG